MLLLLLTWVGLSGRCSSSRAGVTPSHITPTIRQIAELPRCLNQVPTERQKSKKNRPRFCRTYVQQPCANYPSFLFWGEAIGYESIPGGGGAAPASGGRPPSRHEMVTHRSMYVNPNLQNLDSSTGRSRGRRASATDLHINTHPTERIL